MNEHKVLFMHMYIFQEREGPQHSPEPQNRLSTAQEFPNPPILGHLGQVGFTFGLTFQRGRHYRLACFSYSPRELVSRALLYSSVSYEVG